MVEEFKLKKLISPPLLPLSKNQRIRGAPAELAGAPKNQHCGYFTHSVNILAKRLLRLVIECCLYIQHVIQ